MSDWREALLSAARERWHTKTGLLAALALITGPLAVAFAGIDLAGISAAEWIVVVAAGVAVSLIWLKTRLPRVPQGMVGFAIAIECEEDDSSRRAYGDLVLALRENLTGSQFRHKFQFLELPSRVAGQLTDQDRAAALARRANIHFLLYGRARLRTLPDGPSYVFDLRGLVRHAAVERVVSERFGREFGLSLPSRVVLGSEHSFLACEIAAKHIDVVAKYVIGTAAALSSDFAYAEQLLADSESRLKGLIQEAQGAPLPVLLDRVQARLRDLYQEWLARLVRRYTIKRDVEILRLAESLIPKLRQYDETNYSAHLAGAMCAFLLRRDVVQATKEIDACRTRKDATWRYSQAFLAAYEGDLETAYRAYAKAFSAPLEDSTVPTQSEEFIQLILDDEPDRPWLYYCLGLINYRAKGDLEAAQKDLASFVSAVDAARFPKAVEGAHRWLREIEGLLNPKRTLG